MARYTGNKGQVKIDGNIYCTKSWELNEEVGVLDITCQSAVGATARSFASDGLRNATGSFTLDMTPDTTPIRPTVTDPVDFELQDAAYKYSGKCIITSVSTPVAVGEMITVSVNFQVSGAVTVEALA